MNSEDIALVFRAIDDAEYPRVSARRVVATHGFNLDYFRFQPVIYRAGQWYLVVDPHGHYAITHETSAVRHEFRADDTFDMATRLVAYLDGIDPDAPDAPDGKQRLRIAYQQWKDSLEIDAARASAAMAFLKDMEG